jgi:hypothetical protein
MTRATLSGDSSVKHRKNRVDLGKRKNAAMLDFIRLLSVYSPAITIDRSEQERVIVRYIQNTLSLTHDYQRLLQIAFIHYDRGIDEGTDWLEYFKDQSVCDKKKMPSPPRYGEGKEMSTKLKIVNFQSTLKSLAKLQNKVPYAFSFNLSDKLLGEASQAKDSTKSITEKLKDRLESEFGYLPDYYLTAEFGQRNKKLHYHGTILLDHKGNEREQTKEKERVESCFKKVNPKSRSIVLIQQPDWLCYWPLRWGSYISKSSKQTEAKLNHTLYATSNLHVEAKHHYNTLRELIIKCQQGTAPGPITPAQQLTAILATPLNS